MCEAGSACRSFARPHRCGILACPWGNNSLVETPGFCSRLGACRIAASGALVRVPLEMPFVCPECGAPLTAPALGAIRPLTRRPAFLASALGVVALLAASVVLAQAGFLHRHAPLPAPLEEPTIVSFAAIPLQKPTPDAVVDALAEPEPATLAATEPAPRQGFVLHPKPESPSVRHAPAAKRHHANVHLSFSIPLIAGGQPDYPEQYEDGRSGTVTVACKLRPDGGTQGCTTMRRSGGPIFDVAVHSWLDLRDVRFKPPKIRGRLINHVTLTVDFIGEPPPT